MSKKLLLILNPISGKMAGKRYLAEVLGKFCRADYAPLTFVTTGPGHATRLAEQYGGQMDLVVCLGGDGTFNEVVSGLLKGGHQTPVGYIPCGSTNDFASSIGLKRTVPDAADAIIEGQPHTYDIGRFGERYFSYVASFGIFTRASYATPQDVKNALGHLAYVLEGIKELSNIQSRHVRLEVDGRVLEDDYLFGAVSNCLTVGGILALNPERVDMSDGQLELLLVKMPRNPVELSDCIRALVEQKYDSDCITFLSGKEFTVTAPPDMEWSLDGEWGPGSEQAKIRILPGAVTLIH